MPLLSLAVIASCYLPAQVPSLTDAMEPLGRLPVDQNRLYYATGEGEDLWVRGRSYKASINSGGFTYVPFLGSDAPQNYPVRFTLVEAKLSGEELPLLAEAEVLKVGDRWILDRGAVEVRYDLALEDVEQSFAVDAAGASGALELVLIVQTDLVTEGPAVAAHADLRFGRGPEKGGAAEPMGVRYGAATVLDNAGRSLAIPTRLAGDRIHLTVPASFVRRADGRVLVDPVISTYGVSTVFGDQRDVDMAYNLDSDSFLYAFEEQFSGSDTDVVVMQRRASDGAFFGSSYFDLSGNIYKDPSVANLNAYDRSLVVAIQTAVGFSGSTVGAIFEHPTGLGPRFSIDSGGFSSKSHPDVGGCASNDPNSVFMVVWERYDWTQERRSIAARSVAFDGTLGPVEEVSPGNPFYHYIRPAISKSSGHAAAPDSWNLAMVAQLTGLPSSTFLSTAVIGRSGTVTGPLSAQPPPTGEVIVNVDVSETVIGPDHEVWVVAMGTRLAGQERVRLSVGSGSGFSRLREVSWLEHSDPDRQLSEPHLATQEGRFQLTYLERTGNNATAFLTGFDASESTAVATEEPRLRLAFNGGVFHEGGGVAIASKYGGGLSSSRLSGLAWESAGSESDLIGVTHRSRAAQAMGIPYCLGQPNSTGLRGYISIFGDVSLTGPKTLFAGSLPPGSLGMFLISDGYETLPGGVAQPGGLCLKMPVGRIMASVGPVGPDGTSTYTVDPTQLPMPGGLTAAMTGDLFAVQFWHRDAVGGAATFNLTNGSQMYFPWP